MSFETKRRITLANKSYYSHNGQLSSRDDQLPRLPLLSSDAENLVVFKGKILRRIFSLISVSDNFDIRIRNELHELFIDTDVIQHIYDFGRSDMPLGLKRIFQ